MSPRTASCCAPAPRVRSGFPSGCCRSASCRYPNSVSALPRHRSADAHQRTAHINHFVQTGAEQIPLLVLGAFGGRASVLHRKPSSILQGNEPLKHASWQFPIAYQDQISNEIRRLGIVQGPTKKGNCLYNTIMENFFWILKSESFRGLRLKNTATPADTPKVTSVNTIPIVSRQK